MSFRQSGSLAARKCGAGPVHGAWGGGKRGLEGRPTAATIATNSYSTMPALKLNLDFPT